MMLQQRLAYLRETLDLSRSADIERNCLSGGETDSAGSGNMQPSSDRLSLFIAVLERIFSAHDGPWKCNSSDHGDANGFPQPSKRQGGEPCRDCGNNDYAYWI